MIDFNKELKKEFTKYSFEYFLDRIISDNNYSINQRNQIKQSFDKKTKELDVQFKGNKSQAFLYCQNMVGLMVEGRMILDHFRLSNSRSVAIIDFNGYGENWAYFEKWKKIYSGKLKKEWFWNLFIKIGAGLGILMTILKLLEVFCVI